VYLADIHRPPNGSIRWIPYPPFSSSSPSLSQSAQIDNSLDPTPKALALAPPPYGDMLDRITTEEGMREMKWARGKKVVFVGDSFASSFPIDILGRTEHSPK
jgi:hypothetical protein